MDGELGLPIDNIYTHNITNTSFGYQGVRADRVYLELLTYHRTVKREGDKEGVITPAHTFWFEELPSYMGYYNRTPVPGEVDFQCNLEIAQNVIHEHVKLAPHATKYTRCCGRAYTIGPKAPIVGHENISDGQQCAYLASRVIRSLAKLTNWTGQYDLAYAVDSWVEWTLARYGPAGAKHGNECGICYEADTVYELCGAVDTNCHHKYCANCLPRCLRESYRCAFCREVPVEIRVAMYAYGWKPCEVEPPRQNNQIVWDTILVDDSSDYNSDDDDDDDDIDITDDDETDLTYVPPPNAIAEDEIAMDDSSDDELPTIHAPLLRLQVAVPNNSDRRQMRRWTYRSDLFERIGDDNLRTLVMEQAAYSLEADFAASGHNTDSRRMLALHPTNRLGRPWARDLREWYAARYETIVDMDVTIDNGSFTCMTCLHISQESLYEPACCRRAVCETCIETLALVIDYKSRYNSRTILLPRCPCCSFLDPDQSINNAISLTSPEQVGYEHRVRYWRARQRISQDAGSQPRWAAAIAEYLRRCN